MPAKHMLRERLVALTVGCILGAVVSFVAVVFADLPKGALAIVPVCALGTGLITFIVPRSLSPIMVALEAIW
jgi:hypothetical protein